MHWHFTEQTAAVNRDPVEAQFFAEAESDSGRARTDALVRETIQNALDARRQGEAAHVRFAIHEEPQRPDWVDRYWQGLDPHLSARKVDIELEDGGPFRWLVYEDFGTHGLRGDIARVDDPDDNDKGQQFYWFWRNIGRSGKGGEDLGRWGLGKTVLPAASRANAMLGLTARSDDQEATYLMGQCVLPVHKVNGVPYQPEGFLCGHVAPGRRSVPMPIDAQQEIVDFERHWRTDRRQAPGLSVVVPYLREGVEAEELLRSTVLHWFVAILRGDLTVEVRGKDNEVRQVDADTIGSVADELAWNGAKKDKRHRAPPIAFARWAVEQQRAGMPFETELAGVRNAPVWNDGVFAQGQQEELRKLWERRQRIALRVRLELQRKDGGDVDTHFDVFLEPDDSLPAGEDDYARDGMAISGIAELRQRRGVRGLVLVDDLPLSTLLGDTEGPSHVDWKTNNKRPDARFAAWSSRVLFTRQALAKLVPLIERPADGLEADVLADFFGIDDVTAASGAGKRRRKAGTGRNPLPPALPPAKPRWFQVGQNSDGFQVKRNPSMDYPPGGGLRIALAYDGGSGNVFARHDPLDFDLRGGKTTMLMPEVRVDGATATATAANELEIRPDGQEAFRVRVRGFDRTRDLIVRSTEFFAAADDRQEGEGDHA